MTRGWTMVAGLAGLCAVGGGTATFATVSRAVPEPVDVDARQPMTRGSSHDASFGTVGSSPDELDIVTLVRSAQRRLHCARAHDAPVCTQTPPRD